MTCQEVNDYLDHSGLQDWPRLPEMLRHHVENCACCRALWELLSRRPCPRQVPAQVRSKIEDGVLASLEPVAPLPSGGKLTLGFIAIFAGLSALFVPLTGAKGTLGMQSTQFAAVLAVVGAAGVLLSWTLSRAMVPGEKWYLGPPLTLLLPLLGLFAIVASVFPWNVNERLIARSWACFREGSLLALPAAGLAAALLRRGAVLSLPAVGAAAGLLAGLVGFVSLHFSCSVHAAPHIALGHLGVPVAGVLVGYAVGRLMEAAASGRAPAGPPQPGEG